MESTATASASDGSSDNIKIKVSYGSNNFDVFTSSQSTIADLKREIAKATGLEPEVQNLLFRGKEMDDNEHLHMAGVKDNAKVIVLENSVSSSTKNEDLEKVEDAKENSEDIAKVEEVKENSENIAKAEEVKENIVESSRGLEAVRRVREENNEFAEQVASLEAVVSSGTQIADKNFIFVTEMLMRQLLKLDGIDAEGEGRMQRKLEVRRVQGLVDKLDNLKAKNANPSLDIPKTDSIEPSTTSSSKVTQESEVFE